MWRAGLALARPAPWHELQVPGSTPAWSKLVAGDQALVRWQESHDALVWMCPDGLPEPVLPLWQLVQVPGTTPW